MNEYSFTISADDNANEPGRSRLEFANRGFGVFAMTNIPRVRCCRNADGIATHFTFPADAESDVRSAIEVAARKRDAQEVRNAAAAAYEAEAAKRAALAAEKSARRMAELDALVESDPVSITFGVLTKYSNGWCDNDTLMMPYAAGAPSKIKACGGVWNEKSKVWVFAAHRKPEMVALVPELSRLVAAQRLKDAKAAGKPKTARKPRRDSEMDDSDLESMSDDGLTSRVGMTANEVRREFDKHGIRY